MIDPEAGLQDYIVLFQVFRKKPEIWPPFQWYETHE